MTFQHWLWKNIWDVMTAVIIIVPFFLIGGGIIADYCF